nr:hypothetical protein Iba_chr12cCG8820 [Ipomoea batatas]
MTPTENPKEKVSLYALNATLLNEVRTRIDHDARWLPKSSRPQ